MRCALCTEQRDIVTVFGEDMDPDLDAALDRWHARQHPEPGPFLASPGAWPDRRGPGTEDALDAKVFEVAADEVLCQVCWLVHRPGRCDR